MLVTFFSNKKKVEKVSVKQERLQLEGKGVKGNLNQEMHGMEVGVQHLGSSSLPFL